MANSPPPVPDFWVDQPVRLLAARGLQDAAHNHLGADRLCFVGGASGVRRQHHVVERLEAIVLGRLADTLEDRSIIIPMKRKLPGDRAMPLREDRLDLLTIRRRCQRWRNRNDCRKHCHDPANECGQCSDHPGHVE